jgi:hypothetical protein
MDTRLLKLLHKDYRVIQWKQTPIKEWCGFTVEDMQNIGFYMRVLEWFNTLTDEQILAISKKKPLSLKSSPFYP